MEPFTILIHRLGPFITLPLCNFVQIMVLWCTKLPMRNNFVQIMVPRCTKLPTQHNFVQKMPPCCTKQCISRKIVQLTAIWCTVLIKKRPALEGPGVCVLSGRY